jgi:hypothetical protein
MIRRRRKGSPPPDTPAWTGKGPSCPPCPSLASRSLRHHGRPAGTVAGAAACKPHSQSILSPGRSRPPTHSNASPPSFKGGESSPFFPPHASRCRRISVSPATAGGSATSDTLPAATISSPRRMAGAGVHPLSHFLCADGLMDFFPWKAEFSTPFTPRWSTGCLWRPSTVAVTVFPSPGLQHPRSLSALPFTMTAGCFARGRHPVPNPLFRAVKPFCTRQSPVLTLASLPAPTFPDPDTVLIDRSIKDRRAQGGGARS